jgi:predicted translin family RNA/ssDNA-binding protein
MLDKSNFNNIRKDMKKIDDEREKTIQTSRDIISISKRIIYAAQRNDFKTAQSGKTQIEEKVKKLRNIKTKVDTNINSVAFSEYVEAITFFEFVKSGKIPTRASLNVASEDYLAGMCDLTGELGRKAVYEVIHKNYKGASKIRDLVDEIYGEFLKLNLRNGELRKKSDSIKWNLKKLEEIMYDISVINKFK